MNYNFYVKHFIKKEPIKKEEIDYNVESVVEPVYEPIPKPIPESLPPEPKKPTDSRGSLFLCVFVLIFVFLFLLGG